MSSAKLANSKLQALADLATADSTFANVLSTNLEKGLAEQTLAKALRERSCESACRTRLARDDLDPWRQATGAVTRACNT